jgi:hypothetical protein
MMDETNPLAPSAFGKATSEKPSPESDNNGQQEPSTPQDSPSGVPEAVMKFKSCRWRCDPEAGEYCTHRDVLPFAGKEGFVPDSWCPDCGFYKLRRTPKKRDYSTY